MESEARQSRRVRQSSRLQPTSRERLDALVEQRLAAAEASAAEGNPRTARELNGLRRLIERQEADEELAELRRLTTG